MPPKNSQPSYTRRPVRRLRLPKMGPLKTKSLFEEYFYACVAVLFLAVSVLLIAGGLGAFDALVAGAWVAGAVWCGKQLMNYMKVKTKEDEAKASAEPRKPPAGANGKMVLPPGMKPMIGPQWPVKSGMFPVRPGLRTAPSVPKTMNRAPAEPIPPSPQAPDLPVGGAADSAAPGNSNKPAFVYERPTLPDRKPKLPHNWPSRGPKKPKR
jgi:hypothetical protein